MTTTNSEIITLKAALGKKLFAIALKTPIGSSKKYVLDAVKSCKGHKSINQAAAVDGILRVVGLIWSSRNKRNSRRYASRRHASFPPIFTGRTKLDHTGNLAARLAKHKIATARRTISDFMPCLSGDVSGRVSFADDFAGVKFESYTSKGDQYSRRCTYHKTNGTWMATIQPNWNIHVAKRGLASVDGMPTLAALPVESEIEGEEIHRAKWLEKSRGFSAVLRTGYIIRRTIDGRTYTAHAGSIASARSTITRQTPESQRAADERAAAKAQQIERLQSKIAAKLEAGQLNGYAPVVVTVRDSFAVGNCGSGTRNWIAKHLPGRTSATVAEIIQIPDEHPRVLLACLHAIIRTQTAVLTA